MYTPFLTTGAADPRRFRVGNRIRFVEAPISAQFVPAGVTGIIKARAGYRAFEVECDGHPIVLFEFPENMRKCAEPKPYTPAAKFISRRKST